MHMFHCTAMTQLKVRTCSTRTCILNSDGVAWLGLMELLCFLLGFSFYLVLEAGHMLRVLVEYCQNIQNSLFLLETRYKIDFS